MAIAPLNQVRAVLNYATSTIPPDKILLGIPTYGYNWTLPEKPSVLAAGISPKRAQNLAIDRGVTVRFDPLAASPMYHYYVGQTEHEVWYEDAKSILAKFHLVYEMGLRGVSFWVLGQPFPQLWRLVEDTFEVKKV
ncbi:MAG: glycosyl hydrolase family 18 protein [Firmicutes bacterium]|nr:glycosyl hydrolase family 18 protein [Bacillota bacterium]